MPSRSRPPTAFLPDASQSFTLTVDAPPAVSSSNNTLFTEDISGSFTVTTDFAFPAATTLSESGTLPTGITFVDNGNGTATLAGTPAFGTAGTYNLVITAANGILPSGTQDFTFLCSRRCSSAARMRAH